VHYLAAAARNFLAHWPERAGEPAEIAYSSCVSGFIAESRATTSNAVCCVDFSQFYQIASLDPASLCWSLAGDLLTKGAYDESFQMFQEALRFQPPLPGTDCLGTAAMLLKLGVTFGKLQRYDQGLKFLERSLNMIKAAMGVGHSNVAITLIYLGLMCFAMGMYNDAISHYHAARIIKEENMGSDHPNLTETYGLLGEAYFKLGFFDISSE
jgi:tetratricopeptide (TPR) repeat protein